MLVKPISLYIELLLPKRRMWQEKNYQLCWCLTLNLWPPITSEDLALPDNSIDIPSKIVPFMQWLFHFSSQLFSFPSFCVTPSCLAHFILSSLRKKKQSDKYYFIFPPPNIWAHWSGNKICCSHSCNGDRSTNICWVKEVCLVSCKPTAEFLAESLLLSLWKITLFSLNRRVEPCWSFLCFYHSISGTGSIPYHLTFEFSTSFSYSLTLGWDLWYSS